MPRTRISTSSCRRSSGCSSSQSNQADCDSDRTSRCWRRTTRAKALSITVFSWRCVSGCRDYLKDPITFLYLSGWRLGEMKTLEWRDVDIAGQVVRLRPAISKNKDGQVLPLSGELLEIIVRASANRRLDCPFVFHLDGQPVGDFKRSWATACKTAGVGKVLVHDLCRTAVRNMVRAGIPDRVAMALSGHKTRSVFDRYNIVSEATSPRLPSVCRHIWALSRFSRRWPR